MAKKKKKGAGKTSVTSRYTTEVTVHNGYAVINLMDGTKDRFPFGFGLTKAKKIVGNIKAIEAFVEEQLKALEKQASKQKKGAKAAA